MTSRRALALPLLIASALAGLALGDSATAAPAVPRATGALIVSWTDNAFGPAEMAVTVFDPGALGPGEVVINSTGNWISVAPGTGGALLTPGQGCRFAVPDGQPASDYPQGTSVVCGFGVWSYIRIDLQRSTYSGGDLLFASNARLGTSFLGSAHSDEFYGGPGSDSVDGAGGDDAIFGGDGDDWLLGGDGRDLIDGEGGTDVIYGDAGADTITVDEDGKTPDWVNCNNFDRAVQNTDNDPDSPPINRLFGDSGIDRITDCGVATAPVVKSYPTLSGKPTAGKALTAKAGTWEGKALILSYAWFACPTAEAAIPFDEVAPVGDCVEVAATDDDKGLTYTPRSNDVGKFLVLRATARNNSGFAVAASNVSESVKPASVTPGPVRDLRAKLAVTEVRGTRTLSVTVTWKPPANLGPGVKSYVVEVKGLDTPRVVTSESAHTFTVAPFPRTRQIAVKVSAQGPKGERGPVTEVYRRTPRA